MALPPQAIEKLVREPSKSQGAYRELLLLSGAVFGLTVIIYAGLAFGYTSYLRSSLEEVNAEIQSFNAGVTEEDREQIQGFYSQLVNLRTLLGSHTSASPVLDLLSRSVHPDVYFTKLTMNANNNQAVLSGAARSLDAIAAQAAILQDQPEVDHLDFNNAGAQTAGPWQFTMTVSLRPGVFKGAIIDVQPAPLPVEPTGTPTPSPTSTPAGATSSDSGADTPSPTGLPSGPSGPTPNNQQP